jgi:predicted HTH transcriptional regulator
MKMFNLINVGERSGRGIYEIYAIWKNMKWQSPAIGAIQGIDRTIFTLPIKGAGFINAKSGNAQVVRDSTRQYIKDNVADTANDANGTVNGIGGTVNGIGGTVNGADGTVNGIGGTVNGTNGTVNGTGGTVNGCENRKAILRIIAENPQITYDTLSRRLNMPRRTVAREMKTLREEGIIKRIGSDKSGHWEIAVKI